jgi:hypothetical protein
MKRLFLLVCVTAFAVAVVLGQAKKADSSGDDAARAAAVKLYKSLTDDQKKLALKPLDDKERYKEEFPAVERLGLPFSKLTADQKALAEDAVRAMTSDYGAERCLQVAKQTGDDRKYLNFFGEPEEGKPFAWRIAAHHLTLLYAEFGKEKEKEFGPILLGGNPVKTLWDDEEKIVMELRGALSDEEAKAVVQAKGNVGSGANLDKKTGMRIADLGEKPRKLARKLLEQRLAVFSADRRKKIEALIEADGGADNLRLALWGDATKSQRDGGSYSWKIGDEAILCDWQTVGANHIHMTVRARLKS